MLDVDVHVIGYVEVQSPVAVKISEGAACAKPSATAAGASRDVRERAIAVVAVERVAAVVRHVKIVVAVVVVVSARHSHSPAAVLEARTRRNVSKRPVSVVAKEPGRRAAPSAPLLPCCAVNQEQIREAVVIEIQPGHAPGERFDDRALLGASRDKLKMNPRLPRDLDERRVGIWPGYGMACRCCPCDLGSILPQLRTILTCGQRDARQPE